MTHFDVQTISLIFVFKYYLYLHFFPQLWIRRALSISNTGRIFYHIFVTVSYTPTSFSAISFVQFEVYSMSICISIALVTRQHEKKICMYVFVNYSRRVKRTVFMILVSPDLRWVEFLAFCQPFSFIPFMYFIYSTPLPFYELFKILYTLRIYC